MGKNRQIEVIPPDSGKHTAALNSLRGVRREQSRVYRLVVNGKMSSDEGARRIYMLREVRASLEAEPVPEIRSVTVSEINIVGILPNWSVIGLLGDQAHIPNAILPRLRELLPKEAFTPIPDPSIPPPIDFEAYAPSKPMLKVIDGDGAESEPDLDPELPPAA